MQLTGLIFAGIAVAWLAYLVPLYLRRRDLDQAAARVEVDRFADSMRVIRRGRAPLVDHDGQALPEVEVSTPLTRRAAIGDLYRINRLAASRRRQVLIALLALASLVLGLCALGRLPWPSMVAPVLLVGGFVVCARVSVRVMDQAMQERYDAIVGGSDEATILISRAESDAAASVEVAFAGPVSTGALWDPLPITAPTYVSKPLAPRTVRTIELGSSGDSGRGRAGAPVTADAPVLEPLESPDVEVAVVPASSGGSHQLTEQSATG